MKWISTLIFVCVPSFAFCQELPPWAYHSKITPKQRMAGLQKVVDMLTSDAKKNPRSKKALAHLKAKATICEPLGDDPAGNSATRVIASAVDRSNKKHAFFLIPVYDSESAAGSDIKEFLGMGPAMVAGFDGPTLFINIDHLKAKDAVEKIANGILLTPQPTNDKLQTFRKSGN